MANLMNTSIVMADGSVTVVVSGEIDMATSQELYAAIEHALTATHDSLSIELSAVSFCDSSGLGVLVLGEQECKLRGVRYRVIGATGTVRQVFEITGLEDMLEETHERERSDAC
jgi:anti-sigma B factor antagonist